MTGVTEQNIKKTFFACFSFSIVPALKPKSILSQHLFVIENVKNISHLRAHTKPLHKVINQGAQISKRRIN
jgi:hypothetical protein